MSLLHLSYQVIYVTFFFSFLFLEKKGSELKKPKEGLPIIQACGKMNYSDREQKGEITSMKVMKLGSHLFVQCNVEWPRMFNDQLNILRCLATLKRNNSPPTFTSAGYQWIVSTNTGYNQWLSLAKPTLKVVPASMIRSLLTRTSKCGWAITQKVNLPSLSQILVCDRW